MLRATAASFALLFSLSLSAAPLRADDPHPEMDAAIAPLFSDLPSKGDLASMKAAIEAAYRDDIAAARAEMGAISNKTARKLAEWYLLRNAKGAAGPFELEKFRLANPDWPANEIRIRTEEALLESGADPQKVLALFEKEPPRSGAGFGALAAAHLSLGDTEKATSIARKGWRENDMEKDAEAAYLKRLGKLLSAKDHKWKVDRLLLDDSRWEGTRKATVARVKRILPLLSAQERAKAEARIRRLHVLSRRQMRRRGCGGAQQAPGRRIQGLGRRLSQDSDPAPHGSRGRRLDAHAESAGGREPARRPDGWWFERRENAYNALYAGEPKIAYEIVANHGPLSVNPLKDAEFMAGWIALRFLGDPPRAKTHFEALIKAADGPISRSEGEYWLARAYDALDDKTTAKEHYGRAAKEYTTFYGQLARQVLDPKATKI